MYFLFIAEYYSFNKMQHKFISAQNDVTCHYLRCSFDVDNIND